MSELRLEAAMAFATLAKPGRHGRAVGITGVTAAERTGLALAGVIARKGQAAALEAAVQARFGIGLPPPRKTASGTILDLVWAGPEQWLAVADETVMPALAADLAIALKGLASVSDQSDGRGVLRLSGPRVRDALAKGLGIDLHPSVFAPGDTAVSSIAHIGVHLWRVGQDLQRGRTIQPLPGGERLAAEQTGEGGKISPDGVHPPHPTPAASTSPRRGEVAASVVGSATDSLPTYEIAVFRGFASSLWHFIEEAAAEYGLEVTAPVIGRGFTGRG